MDDLTDCRLIFAMPNADTGSFLLSSMVDGVVENSSNGIAEAPSMGIGTINIGDRQRGRLMADSVIDCEPDAVSISTALQRPYSTEFQSGLATMTNLHGNGGTSQKIVQVLGEYPLEHILKKSFYDLADISPRVETSR
ncbi:UDP-N-acetylglucosamine 2-epimerase [Janthinobacterium sp. SUN118]|uniref:UDP-N-acetylglucosamine 2-epimerase n=1 Tax=Janthinobacterium sp. SUN118 TaxID=3004100 RepID=UPI0025B03263|nr:UDP-N-acetylglucosamine 2-epimerase [Janthinobacterium sp. SUN118]MDN2708449.1 UDP-N-acetylglucosamine 2-epimerase [Janthinobacterium sp. SUN118]